MPHTDELPELTPEKCAEYAAKCRRCAYGEGVAFWEARTKKPNELPEPNGEGEKPWWKIQC